MRISFKRNGFIALASMLSFAVYAGDNLPLATAASGTNGSIQVSEHGVDTSNEIQQARVIQGTVLEEGTNEPLIGVNVVVKGTTIGTTTDVEGKYSIRIPSDNAVLVLGVRYDAVDGTMYIDSKIGDFKSFISTDTGFGTIEWKHGKPSLEVVYGTINVKRYNISGKIID